MTTIKKKRASFAETLQKQMNAPSAEPMNKMTAESDNSSPCIRLRKNFDDLDPPQTPEPDC